MNNMQEIRIGKVTLNIGTGEPGDKLDKAIKLLNTISKEKVVITKTKKRIPGWGLRPGLQIGCKVTLRKKKAENILPTLLKAIDNKLSATKFDIFGNFSFGIHEYLDIPGIKYDPEIGIIGLDVAVTLERPGFRIKKRKLKRKNVKNGVSKEEAMKFMKEKFNVEVEE